MESMKKLKLAPGVPYQKMYTTLFNAITDALQLIEKENSAEAIALLKRAQQSSEDQYVNTADG